MLCCFNRFSAVSHLLRFMDHKQSEFIYRRKLIKYIETLDRFPLEVMFLKLEQVETVSPRKVC